ncbi:MAG: PP2C family protein-serine/threonine phosphatase [Stellaceae bacterium]
MTATPIATSIMAAGPFRSSAASHTSAARQRNEDSFVNRPDLGLWAVADGAGGHQAGDVAARLIADALEVVPAGLGAAQLLAEVRQRLAEAHRAMQREAVQRGALTGLGSTIVVLLARDAHYACLWAGDSRAYLMRAGGLRQLTHDHSLVQQLLDSGAIGPAEAAHHPQRNIITRALGGPDEAAELDKVTDRLRPGDRFLLCSDGLSKTVPDEELCRVMAETGDEMAARLVAAALDRQANDNVTAVAVELLAEGSDTPKRG